MITVHLNMKGAGLILRKGDQQAIVKRKDRYLHPLAKELLDDIMPGERHMTNAGFAAIKARMGSHLKPAEIN